VAEPVWILDVVVRAIHQRQIAEHGGLSGLRDEGLLASALAKPRNLYNYANPKPSIAEIAATYAYGLARNHAFLDGNKRTAYVTCLLFLKLNNCTLTAPDTEKYITFMKLADGSLDEAELAAWIAAHI
jgi:death on curing protein